MDSVRSALPNEGAAGPGEDAAAAALRKIAAGAMGLGEMVGTAAVLSSCGQLELARQLYRAWIAANPEDPMLHVALFNSAGLEGQAGDEAAAEAALERALALSPDFIPAHINLGTLFERRGEPAKAIERWRIAASRPAIVTGAAVSQTATALKQIARVLSDHQQLDSAEAALARCIELDPRDRQLSEQYIAMRLGQCKWPVLEPREGLDRKALLSGIHPLSLEAYSDDPLFQLAASERYVRRSVDAPGPDHGADRRDAPTDVSGRRLRLGYVSSDLRDHAIGYLMAELFEVHDPEAVEVFAYYCGPPSTSALNARIRASVEHWIDIRDLSADDAARRIAADRIDVLVDVNGHTRDAKTEVFARRPAPIQVNWLGYPGTTGSPYHQYIIADDWIIPPEFEIYYSEKVVRLPCYQPNDGKRLVATPAPTRAEAGLQEGVFVFCSFAGAQKITRFMFDRWIEILRRVPASVLWMLQPASDSAERLCSYAEARGIDRSRFVFAQKVDSPRHLARHALADLFLDTAPYGAHTTASDALFMSVPILTLSGRSFASRVCGSLVRAAGLPELVCTTPRDYVERAVTLGNNPAAVEACKVRLRASHSSCVLFDTVRLARAVEELYRGMCADHQAGRLPRPDLSNLDAYFQAGLDHDHEAEEMLGLADYNERYRARLAARHRDRPMAPDTRLWTAADIAEADAPGGEAVVQIRPAALIESYNHHLAAGEIEQAEPYAAALVALAPDNPELLAAALTCNHQLGRIEPAAAYAERLAKIDPEHPAARTVLAEACQARGDIDGEIEHRMMLALSPRNELHPLIRLRDLHDAASLVLRQPPGERAAAQIARLAEAAHTLVVDAPEGSEMAVWEKHYRLMMQAMDLEAALGPTPRAARASAKTPFLSAGGERLGRKELKALAERLGAEAVFFAAADRAYVDLYARWYALSILSQSDVRSLVVIHVIGGQGELEEVAASVGIKDERLIFTGDGFDPGKVGAVCHDAPPKGRADRPLAQYQSVRFQRLGEMLDAFALPVFVSDIDLLLQRGVKDLLERCSGADIVLNENEISLHAGSRLTANLLLARPTPNAAVFIRYLGAYLTRALGRPEVTRWIDQMGLLFARAHLLARGDQPRIDYFDTRSDINNVMYPAYQENPFRFLSLYHGFDLSSLEVFGESLATGSPAAGRRRKTKAA